MSQATDLLTLAEAHDHLSMAGSFTGKDSVLAVYISSVTSAIENLTGPIVQRTYTDELYPGGTGTLFLRHPPVVSVTTVTEYAGGVAQVLTAEALTSSTGYDYLLDLNLGSIARRSSWSPSYFGSQAVKVTYVAGRCASTAAVPERFKLAAGITLAHIYKPEQGSGNETFGDFPTGRAPWAVPNQAKEVLYIDDLVGPGSIPAIA